VQSGRDGGVPRGMAQSRRAQARRTRLARLKGRLNTVRR
jgi:hypothetical protein